MRTPSHLDERSRWLPALALFACVASPFASSIERPSTEAIDARFAELDRNDAPGIVIGVARQGETLYLRAFGMADIQHKIAMTTRHALNVGSVSKQFTAFSAALLAEQGKMSLDRGVATYLSGIPKSVPAVTARHLIHHTSGWRDHYPLFVLAGQSIRNENSQQQTLNLVRRQRDSNFRAGTEYEYCNTNYVALAEIVASVSGSTFRDYLHENVFSPLGMTDTFVYDDAAEESPRIAESYSQDADGSWRRYPRRGNYVGSTGLHTTAADLLKWTRNWAQPTIGGKELIARFLTLGSLDDGTPLNYGFGLQGAEFAGGRAWVHDGLDAGYQALLTYFPQTDLTIALIANGPFDLSRKRAELIDLFLGAGSAVRVERVPQATQASGGLAESLAGDYQTAFDPMIRLRNEDGKLVLRSPEGKSTPFTFREDGTFDLGDAPRREGHYFAIRKQAGAATGIERVISGVNRRALERVARVEPQRAALQDLVGDYESRELSAIYSLMLDADRQLAVTLPWLTEPITLQPISADRFEWSAPPYFLRNVLTVRRNRQGAVESLLLHVPGRVRNLALERRKNH